jgi:hypothetical protein
LIAPFTISFAGRVMVQHLSGVQVTTRFFIS